MKYADEILVVCILCIVGCTQHNHEDSATISLRMKGPQESVELERALTKLAADMDLNERAYSSHSKLLDPDYEVFDVEYMKYDPKYLSGILFRNNSTGSEEQDYACLKIDVFVVTDENVNRLKPMLKELNNFLRENIRDHREIYVDTECGKRPKRFKD